MITAWTKNCKTDAEKVQLEQTINNSKAALDRQIEILNEMEEEINSSELSAKNYDSPCWGYKQAHVNGQKATLRAIKRLINLDPKEK